MKCYLLNFEEFQWCHYLFSFDSKILFTGGMTEEKKTIRRKTLAKWLKESILRLGPTFIKIGQQFSTRVDILPQEYVDQLSELQVKLQFWTAFIRLFPCMEIFWTCFCCIPFLIFDNRNENVSIWVYKADDIIILGEKTESLNPEKKNI